MVNSLGYPSLDNTHYQKVGRVTPSFTMGFGNEFSYKHFSLGFQLYGRFGGQVISATQSILDANGESKVSAQARDAGGVKFDGYTLNPQQYYGIIGGGTGGTTNALAMYVYSATNVRLSELSFGYTFPSSDFHNRIESLKVSVVGRNLWMIYNKAPFDPESAASTSTFYQGFDYFNPPSLRNIGIRLSVSL